MISANVFYFLTITGSLIKGANTGELYRYPSSTTFCSQKFMDSSGTFHSPGYPENYTNGLYCEYTILPYKDYNTVELTLEEIDIEENDTCCDYLRLPGILHRVCGKRTNLTVRVTTKRHVQVTFITNDAGTSRGFLAHFKLTKCKTILSGKSGTFNSLDAPFRLMNCSWEITVGQGKFAQVSFNTGSNLSCSGHHINIFVGKNKTFVGRQFCAKKAPKKITSHDNRITVQIISGFGLLTGGFSAQYKALKQPGKQREPLECDKVLTESTGIITSPGYPKKYFPNLNCTWTIQPKIPQTYIQIDINSLELEEGVSGRCYDYYRVLSIGVHDPKRFFKYCKQPPDVLKYSAKTIKLRLITDGFFEETGFNMTYKTVDLPCGGNLTNNQGEIFYPRFIPANTSCAWFITVEQGFIVELRFTKFNLLNSGTGYIDIFSGPIANNDTWIGRYSNTKKVPPVLRSKSNTMIVKFDKPYNGDSEAANSGKFAFKAQYTANLSVAPVKCGGIRTSPIGYIHSPGQNEYPTHITCIWNITVDTDSFIRFTVRKFILDQTFRCTEDYVQFLYPDGETSRRYCEPFSIHPKIYHNRVDVIFVSDHGDVDAGFIITYNTDNFKDALMKMAQHFAGEYKFFNSRATNTVDLPIQVKSYHQILRLAGKKKASLPILFEIILRSYHALMTYHIELGGSLFGELMDAYFNILNILVKRQTNVGEILFLVPSSKMQTLHNSLKNKFILTIGLLDNLNDLWKLFDRKMMRKVPPIPFIHLRRLHVVAAGLMHNLFRTIKLLDAQQLDEVVGVCNVANNGPGCILEKVEEVEINANFLQQILTKRARPALMDKFNETRNKIDEIVDIKEDIIANINVMQHKL